jgi:hypothetical protein
MGGWKDEARALLSRFQGAWRPGDTLWVRPQDGTLWCVVIIGGTERAVDSGVSADIAVRIRVSPPEDGHVRFVLLDHEGGTLADVPVHHPELEGRNER